MGILGPRAAVDLVVPTGIDGGEVFKFTVLRQKTTAAEVLAETAAAIGAVNEMMMAEYGNMVTLTESMYAVDRQGHTSRTMTPRRAEFKKADAIHSDVIGHMLPIEDYADALAWTPQYLRDAYQAQITADVSLIADRWRNRFEFGIVKRMLTNTENLIGTAGYDVGFVSGSGGNVDYVPPQWGANIFDENHNHYNAATVVEGFDVALEEAVTDIREHGFTGRLAAFVAEADLSDYRALTNFVELKPQEVTIVAGNANAPIRYSQGEFTGVIGTIFGYYNSPRGLVELRYSARIPDQYGFVFQPMGQLHPRNPFAIRVHPDTDWGLRPVPVITNIANPELELVEFKATQGIGVNDRLNGVAFFVDAGEAYVNPTDSLLGAAADES